MSETTTAQAAETVMEPTPELEVAGADEETAAREPEVSELDVQMLRRLADQARGQGLELTGEGGLLRQLTRLFLESALEGEMDARLGYARHDPAGDNSGNSRNGRRGKTVITQVGPVEIAVPRDRDALFEPQIVRKRQRRLTGVDEMVLSLSAKGLTHGEISAHLAEVYGAKVSKTTITAITERVMDGMSEWQNRPLDRVYPVIFIDAINAGDLRWAGRQPAHLPRPGRHCGGQARHPGVVGRGRW
jgi:putative transposase